MQISYLQVSVGKKTLTCSLEGGKPRIEFKKKSYTTVATLLKVVPELGAPDNLDEYARVANFLTGGTDYVLIDDITAFSRSYRRRIWQEKSSMSHTMPRLSDAGVFNISGIVSPRLDDGKIVFYVEHSVTGVPYKGTLIDGTVHYSLLPEAE